MFTRFAGRPARRTRRAGGALVSAGLHAGVAWLAAVATVRASEAPPAPPPPDIVYVVPPPPARDATPAPRGAAGRAARRAPSRGALVPPRHVPTRHVPTTIPAVDVDVPTSAADPLAVAADLAAQLVVGNEGADGAPASGAGPGGVWAGAAVEVEARARPGNPAPAYPSPLEAAGVGGAVTARFVVDSTGRVERGSVRLTGDDPRLVEAVRRVLPRHRFEPARVGGRRVRQLVEQPFVFAPRP